ncbi:MAG: hypothetical protein U5M51_08650 [Emticicia sp.]|nr:hypothetical protein [Emticicia sp.]
MNQNRYYFSLILIFTYQIHPNKSNSNHRNDHQFYGIGVNAGMMGYQVSTGDAHVFCAAASVTASDEIMRINANGSFTAGRGREHLSLQSVLPIIRQRIHFPFRFCFYNGGILGSWCE